VLNWLAAFDAALAGGDLVSFTWNLKTMEGTDAIRAMLDSRLAVVRPSGWAITGEATESGGVSEGSTHIARSDSPMELGLGALYSEQAMASGITTDTADVSSTRPATAR
jgi:putative flavoprotein involved in K+ transport